MSKGTIRFLLCSSVTLSLIVGCGPATETTAPEDSAAGAAATGNNAVSNAVAANAAGVAPPAANAPVQIGVATPMPMVPADLKGRPIGTYRHFVGEIAGRMADSYRTFIILIKKPSIDGRSGGITAAADSGLQSIADRRSEFLGLQVPSGCAGLQRGMLNFFDANEVLFNKMRNGAQRPDFNLDNDTKAEQVKVQSAMDELQAEFSRLPQD